MRVRRDDARHDDDSESGVSDADSATATFVSREHGKDKDSGLTVQLLRNNAELVGEIYANGIKFDDHSSSNPFVLALTGGPFTTRDINDGQVRVRLTPDGTRTTGHGSICT